MRRKKQQEKLDEGLPHALKAGGMPCVMAYLDQGANINSCDNDGATILHKAAAANHDTLCRELIARGANLDLRDGHGNTPLHLAAAWDNSHAAAILLTAGAHPYIKNVTGATPLDIAPETTKRVIRDVIVQRSLAHASKVKKKQRKLAPRL